METSDSKRIVREYRLHWENVLNKLFNFSIPSNCTWDKLDTIIKILRAIGDNHHRVTMFIPGSGEISFRRAIYAQEPGCIELEPEAGFIVSPKRLTFYAIGENVDWHYFLLETNVLKKICTNCNTNSYYEILTEIEPGKYIENKYQESENIDDEGLTKPRRNISRYNKGNFVFFINTSDFNNDASRLDMQNKLSTEDFQVYIETMHNHYKKNRMNKKWINF